MTAVPAPTDLLWLVCHTKPRCEKKFAALMKAEKFEHYLALVQSVRHYRQQTKRFTKPLFPGYVFACVPANSPSFGHLSECRFQGLVIDLERWANEPARVIHHLQNFGEKAAGLASVLAVQGLASRDMFEVARAAGLTHASLRDCARTRSLAA